MVSAEGACAATYAVRPRIAARRAVAVAVKDAILRKARESADVKEQFFRAEADRIEALARAMAGAFERGGRLYVMGNGGGATDAQHVAVEFCTRSSRSAGRCRRSRSTADPALLTAIANDRDFAKVFADQLRRARAGPATWRWRSARAGSRRTSSTALEVARELGLLTIAFTGKDGGRLADARRPLLRGAVVQHPPHPGDPRGAATTSSGTSCTSRSGEDDVL